MTFAVEPAPIPTLPIADSDSVFPVRRIFCVGRNYVAHAIEMGVVVDREAPFYFLKSAHHLVLAEGEVPMAPRTEDYHHEIELVVALGRGGRSIAQADALSHILGFAVGLDMTRRDLQGASKSKQRPWDTGKDVESSAICSPLKPVEKVPGMAAQGPIELRVNGLARQEGDVRDHVWSIEEIIADLSTLYTLQPGDLIFMGTPSGVAAVQAGDVLEGSIEGVGEFRVTMAPELA